MNKIPIVKSIILLSVLVMIKGTGLRAQEQYQEGLNLLLIQDGTLDRSLDWMNLDKARKQQSQTLRITAEKGTDFFIDPENGKSTATAPVLYKEVKGDFTAIAKVRPDFSAQWNACALMVLIDEVNWIKLAFENSDATGPSVVSVVTRKVSDDANGAIMADHRELWLKLVRKGDVYGMFWSDDGTDFRMVRIARMPASDQVKVGLEAQCPVGDRAEHEWLFFSVENKTVADLRKGY